MAASIEVRRLRVENGALAEEAIRTIKREGESNESASLDSTDMQAWLSRSSNVLIVATETVDPVGFALGYFLDRVNEARTMLFFYEIEVAVAWRRQRIGTRLI